MALNIHIKIDGAEGDSVHTGHEKEIDVLAYSWGLSQSGSAHIGKGAGSGKVSIQDLSITKYVDKASSKLVLFGCNGAHIPKVVLTVSKVDGGTSMVYERLTLEDVIVSSFSTGGSGGEDKLTENVTLNFGKFEFGYTPQKADQTADTELKAGWKIPENEKV